MISSVPFCHMESYGDKVQKALTRQIFTLQERAAGIWQG
jgi:hypothetical protein